MNKIIVYGLIFLFLYLIIQHLLSITKEGLENNCTTASDATDGNSDGGCKRVAVQQNTQAAQYTKTIMKNAKIQIEALINNDYLNSKKYFSKLNNFSQYNLFFEDFLGSVLMSSSEASLKNKKKKFRNSRSNSKKI